jgi:hypothetical protein
MSQVCCVASKPGLYSQLTVLQTVVQPWKCGFMTPNLCHRGIVPPSCTMADGSSMTESSCHEVGANVY